MGQCFSNLWQIILRVVQSIWVTTSPQGRKKNVGPPAENLYCTESLQINNFLWCVKTAVLLHQVACLTVWSLNLCKRSWTPSCAGTRASSWRASQRRTNRPSRSSAVSFRDPFSPLEEIADVVDRQHLRVALLFYRRGGRGGWVLLKKAGVQHQNHSR